MKANTSTKEIPVIILSNLESPEHIDYALRLGAAAYLSKANHQPEEIVDRVVSVLSAQTVTHSSRDDGATLASFACGRMGPLPHGRVW